ncbi:hypothetical protein CN115_12725, partial [Sinorhizobium meliloti]
MRCRAAQNSTEPSKGRDCVASESMGFGRYALLSAPTSLTFIKLEAKVTGRLLPRRFRLDASDDFFVVDEAVEEVVPGFR